MATIKPELKAILERYGINPRDTSQVWDCRGTLVLYHKAYEIIAAKEGIKFDPPQVIRGNKDEAVIVVAGRMGERVEWSFGEAAIGQNYQVSGKQAAYPYAMAEKRAKDRVIAKLAGLAAYVHSEDEADEFKDGERKPVEVPENGNGHAAAKPVVRSKFDLLDPNGDKIGSYSAPEDWCDAARLALTNYSDQAASIWAVNSPTGAVIREHYPDIPKWKFGVGSYHPVAVLARMAKDATKPLELVP